MTWDCSFSGSGWRGLRTPFSYTALNVSSAGRDLLDSATTAIIAVRLGYGQAYHRSPLLRRKTMTKKFICLALGALLLALSFPVEAQQPKKLIRIGMLITGSVSSYKSR